MEVRKKKRETTSDDGCADTMNNTQRNIIARKTRTFDDILILTMQTKLDN